MASKIYSGEEAQSSNLAAGHVSSGIAPTIVARGSKMRTSALRPFGTLSVNRRMKQGCPRIVEACRGICQFPNRPSHCRPRLGR